MIFYFRISFIFLLLFSSTTFAQNREKSFEQTVYKLIKAAREKDNKTINSLINKDYKLVTIYRIGVPDVFSFIDSIDLNWTTDYIINYHAVEVTGADYKIQYEPLPQFECDTEKWNKPPGLYCDKNKADRVFTNAVRFYMDYEMRDNQISEKQYQLYRQLEENSRKIILLMEDGTELCFSLTWLNGKWWFTILDRVSSDCSA